MTRFLVVFTTDHPEGLKIPLDSPQVTVGRDPRCNFRPEIDLVSKLHCAFLLDDEGVVLRDLKSTNGTFVNGARLVDAVRLRDGDQIRFATMPAIYRATTMAAVAKPAAPQATPKLEAPVAAAVDPNEDPLAYLFDGDLNDNVPLTVTDLTVSLPTGLAAADTTVETTANALTETVSGPAKPAPAPAVGKPIGDTRQAAQDALARYMSPRRSR